MFIKPHRLKGGDTVATISPYWVGAVEPALQWCYKQGIQRLEDVFGLNVIAMPNSLKGADYLYHHPEARADDLMEAFKDSSIKAIIANIGGEDSIRLLPYIDMVKIRYNKQYDIVYSY